MKTKRLICIHSSEGLKSQFLFHNCTNICPILQPEEAVWVRSVTQQSEASLHNNEVSPFLCLLQTQLLKYNGNLCPEKANFVSDVNHLTAA